MLLECGRPLLTQLVCQPHGFQLRFDKAGQVDLHLLGPVVTQRLDFLLYEIDQKLIRPGITFGIFAGESSGFCARRAKLHSLQTGSFHHPPPVH